MQLPALLVFASLMGAMALPMAPADFTPTAPTPGRKEIELAGPKGPQPGEV
jgi:hypothetical protein